MAFLDENGLQRFWENIVSKFVRKVDGKDLSSNDYTNEDKEKLTGLENYTDATTSAAGLMSSADKTKLDKIKVDSSGNTTVYDTDVKWGGNNHRSGGVSAIGSALSSEHNANRLAYLNPNAITIEASDDGGSSWMDINTYSDSNKVALVTKTAEFYIGNASTVTTDHRTRITITAQNGTNQYVYTSPRKLLLYVNTMGHGLSVTLEAKKGASDSVWETIGTYAISGWSGWNDIPLSLGTFGGSAIQTGQYWYMRLTFATTAILSSNTTKRSTVKGIRLFGDNCWKSTSNLGNTGHLYDYDTNQNATFPAKVTATKFVGDGSELTNLDATKLIGVVPAANLPSYVDDVIEVANYNALPLTGETGKIYIDLATNKTYRWSGSTYIEISSGSEISFQDSTWVNERAGEIGTLTINGTDHTLYSPTPWDVGAMGNYTSTDILPVFFSNSVLPETSAIAAIRAGEEPQGLAEIGYHSSVGVQPSTGVLFGAAWNDYAETRRAYSEDFKYMKPGCVVTECAIENDTVRLTDKRLEKIPMVITDTYGFLIGEKEGDVVPVAVAGRVLVNTYEDRSKFELGDAVCSGPNGTVSIMTYEELLTFPDRVLGYVSCIPDYDTWNGVKINNRIWIKLK